MNLRRRNVVAAVAVGLAASVLPMSLGATSAFAASACGGTPEQVFGLLGVSQFTGTITSSSDPTVPVGSRETVTFDYTGGAPASGEVVQEGPGGGVGPFTYSATSSGYFQGIGWLIGDYKWGLSALKCTTNGRQSTVVSGTLDVTRAVGDDQYVFAEALTVNRDL